LELDDNAGGNSGVCSLSAKETAAKFET